MASSSGEVSEVMCAASSTERSRGKYSSPYLDLLRASETEKLILTGSSKPVEYLYNHRKEFNRITAILSLAATAAVGIAILSDSPESTIDFTTPTQSRSSQSTKTHKSVSGPKDRDVPVIGEFGFSLGSPQSLTPSQPSIKPKQTPVEPKPESVPSPTNSTVAESPQRVTEETTVKGKEFVEIKVELRVQDGRVVEAHVANRQAGAEGFEAAALRMTRQRRYAPGTSRTETLVLRVANQLGSKEP